MPIRFGQMTIRTSEVPPISAVAAANIATLLSRSIEIPTAPLASQI